MHTNHNKWGSIALWIFLALFYVSGQAFLYGQDRSEPHDLSQPPVTPWEHITLEGFLVFVVGTQYRENRQKEAMSIQMSKDATAAIARATEIMENVTGALERLSGKVDACPAKIYPPPRMGSNTQ